MSTFAWIACVWLPVTIFVVVLISHLMKRAPTLIETDSEPEHDDVH